MQAVTSFTSSIKSWGQLTIPGQLRTLSLLDEGQMVSVIPVGDAVLVAPRRIELRKPAGRCAGCSGNPVCRLKIFWRALPMKEKLFTKKCMERKSVRIFLDSNVILSGLLFDKGAPGVIFDILSLNLPLITAVTGRCSSIEAERNLKKLPALLPIYKNYFRKSCYPHRGAAIGRSL